MSIPDSFQAAIDLTNDLDQALRMSEETAQLVKRCVNDSLRLQGFTGEANEHPLRYTVDTHIVVISIGPFRHTRYVKRVAGIA